jgi:hypothetical protein
MPFCKLFVHLIDYFLLCRSFLIWCIPTCISTLLACVLGVKLKKFPRLVSWSYFLSFLPGILKFQISRSNLQFILSWSLYLTLDQGPVSLFSMWTSSLPNTVCCRGFLFPVYFCQCWRSVDCICVNLFWTLYSSSFIGLTLFQLYIHVYIHTYVL